MSNNNNLAALEAEMNSKNAALKKAVNKTLRAGGVPSAFAVEKAAAMVAYKAYWGAVDAAAAAAKGGAL
jgi:hypothetical protein